MATATGANVREAWVLETVAGTTPTSPAFQEINFTSEAIGLTVDTIVDETIRKDGQLSDVTSGNRQVGGNMPASLRYGEFDVFLEAALGGTWDVGVPTAGTDQLKSGTEVRSYTIERFHEDVVAYFRNTGIQFSGFTLNRDANAITTIDFTVVGLNQTTATSELAGATYAGVSTVEPMNAFNGSFDINGQTDACVTTMSLSLDRANEAQFCIGSDISTEQVVTTSDVTGSLSITFEDLTAYTLFNAQTYFALEIVLEDAAGNEIKFILPRIKYTSADIPVSGKGVITQSYEITATHDVTTGTNLIIERNPI